MALGVALVTMVVVATGLHRLDGARRAYEQQGAIVVAAVDVAIGDVLSAADVRVVHVPEAARPRDAIVTPEQVAGVVARMPIVTGGVITQRHLASDALVLPGGTRAVTVSAAAGDVVVVGSTVDLIASADGFGATPELVSGAVVLAVRAAETWDDALLVTVRVRDTQLAAIARLVAHGRVVLANAPA